MIILKKPSKKTLHRRSRVFGVKSDRRIQNQLNVKIKVKTLSVWKRINRKVKTEKHIELVSTKLSLQQTNMLIVRSLGYTPRATKVKRNTIHLQPRNIRVDGWSCKERRLILLAQRKLQNTA
jgi:hypothetical protein